MSEINGAIVLTPYVKGTIANNLYVTGSCVIPIVIRGQVSTVAGIYGEAVWLELPTPTCSGEAIVSILGIANIDIPSLEVAAEGHPSTIEGIANIELPSLSVGAVTEVSIVGILNITLPELLGAGVGMTNSTGVLNCELPILTFVGNGLSGILGTLARNLPVLSLSSSSYISNFGTLSKTLPIFVIGSASLASAGYLSMVLNIKNRALTLYDNYDFNSMCRFSGKHFGATKTAIYDLDTGSDDAGTDIVWNFKTGYLDLEQKLKKKIHHAWLSFKTDGDIILSVIQPDGQQYEYFVEGISTETGLKCKIGKGIRSKYISIDIKNIDGSTIDFDTLKLQYDLTGKVR